MLPAWFNWVERIDTLVVLGFSLLALFAWEYADIPSLSKELLLGMEALLLIIFAGFSISLKSTRRGVLATLPVIFSVLYTALIHRYLFPVPDAFSFLSYFVVAVMSALLYFSVLSSFFSSKKAYYEAYEEKRREITLIVALSILISFLLSIYPPFAQFGITSAIGIAISYFLLIFLLPSLLRIHLLIKNLEKIQENEEKLKKLIKKYGKKAENYPFYASWLGIAVNEIERLIDSLEAKGFLGHNFFAVNNGFYWFIVLISTAFAVLPRVKLMLILFMLIYAAGVALLGPQMFGKERRALGILLVISALAYFKSISKQVFLLASAGLILALVSIYFAYKDEEYLSALFASFYVANIYNIARHAIFEQVSLFLPVAIAFLTFFLLAFELYMQGY